MINVLFLHFHFQMCFFIIIILLLLFFGFWFYDVYRANVELHMRVDT